MRTSESDRSPPIAQCTFANVTVNTVAKNSHSVTPEIDPTRLTDDSDRVDDDVDHPFGGASVHLAHDLLRDASPLLGQLSGARERPLDPAASTSPKSWAR